MNAAGAGLRLDKPRCQEKQPMTTLAGDPDLEHLLQLLSMLPGPAEDIPFWASIRARVVGPDPEWPDRVDYAFQKMQGVWNVIQDPSPTRVMGLAEYMLVFFSGDDPELWKLLNRVTNRFFSLKYDDAGRWSG